MPMMMAGFKHEMKNRRRREQYKKASKKCNGNNIEHGFCRACGGLREDQSVQHCNKCSRRRRSNNLKRQYGITLEEYDELAAAQNNVCWICKGTVTSKRGYLHVDHCHETGRVRGLLCGKCNAGLGGFRDSLDLLKKALEYLQTFNT